MNVYIYIVSIRKCHKNSADEITKNARQVLHGEAKEAFLTGNLSTGNWKNMTDLAEWMSS